MVPVSQGTDVILPHLPLTSHFVDGLDRISDIKMVKKHSRLIEIRLLRCILARCRKDVNSSIVSGCTSNAACLTVIHVSTVRSLWK